MIGQAKAGVSVMVATTTGVQAMIEFKTLHKFTIGEHSRFAVAICRTRFNAIECFGHDASEFSDDEVAQGLMQPFAQGTLEAVMEAIHKRDATAW